MNLEPALLLWLVGALAGSMLFFGVIVAPQVFRALPADAGGRFLRAFFPNYYLWGATVSLLAVGVALFTDALNVLLSLALLGAFIYARQVLMPRINAARDAAQRDEDGAHRHFARLHRISVIINAIQFVILLVIALRLIA